MASYPGCVALIMKMLLSFTEAPATPWTTSSVGTPGASGLPRHASLAAGRTPSEKVCKSQGARRRDSTPDVWGEG